MKPSLFARPMRGPWPQPDFIAAGLPTPLWLWAALGMSALMFALACSDALALHTLQNQEAERAEVWQRRAQAKAASKSSNTPAASNTTRERSQPTEALRAAQQISAHLQYPWAQVLGSVESLSASGVQWLALEHDADRPELRLEGLAPDARTVLGVVDVLATRPAWASVVLTKLASVKEPATQESATKEGAPETGVRFEVVAQRGTSNASQQGRAR